LTRNQKTLEDLTANHSTFSLTRIFLAVKYFFSIVKNAVSNKQKAWRK